ncbi:MAG: dihydrolipoyl dehydrogenase [Desulfobacterales bacterium]|nr:dihydrolipoyl dehydrogenase [Desulfobacterales bacterium]
MAVRIVVIGAGPGGYIAAMRSAQLGAEVTVIERDRAGGTCLNRGCIPSKMIKHTAQMFEDMQRSGQFGIEIRDARVDMKLVQDRKEKLLENQAAGILKLLKHHKIRHLKGRGFVKGPNLAEVVQDDQTGIEVPWDRLIIATGSEPMPLSSFSFDGKTILSSTDALNLQQVPESVLIVGAGAIGCEFACMLSALGSRVTLVEAMDRILPGPHVDADMCAVLQREMKKRKIQILVNRIIEAIEKIPQGVRASIGTLAGPGPEGKAFAPVTVEVQNAVVCIGRRPLNAGLGLEKIGVRTDEKGWILADDRMQTRAPGVYAIGDALGPRRPMLAHVASTEGITAAQNAMGAQSVMNYDVIPGVIYTMPEAAHAGLTESQARKKGVEVRSETVLFRSLGMAHALGTIEGQIKMLSDARTGKLLGVHIVGPHASDLIAEGALAIRLGSSVKDLADTVHAHPSLSEIMLEAALKSLGKPLHG